MTTASATRGERAAGAARAAARWFVAAGAALIAAAAAAAGWYGRAFDQVEPLPGVGNGEAVVARLRACAADEPFAFAVIGDVNNLDSRGLGCFRAALARATSDRDVRFVLLGGDLVGSPAAREYGFFLSQMRAAAVSVPVFIAPGNHDLGAPGNPGLPLFRRAFARDYTAFEYGNSLFLVLNNGIYLPDGEQRAWLDRELAARAPRARHVFAIAHRPIVDYLAVPARARLDPDEFPLLLEIFARHGVDFFFSGHAHGVRRYRAGGTTHLVLGGRSKEEPGEPPVAGAVVRVKGERVEEEYFAAAQPVFDWSIVEEKAGVDAGEWCVRHGRGLIVYGVLLAAAAWWGWRRPSPLSPVPSRLDM
ncbi:MAG: metallophosphoesterase [Planctomycetes bacterium]|nr:metallophosphoesterase [Planctomycetota bacterium]